MAEFYYYMDVYQSNYANTSVIQKKSMNAFLLDTRQA
jgi:hypothetical protein